MAAWQKTFRVAWVAQFLSLMGFSFVWPFLPFFIQNLGVESEAESAWWTGLSATAAAMTMFLFSPVWGALADRFGRKPMVLRSMFSAAVVVTAMGFVTNVYQFLALRALQGALTGTVTASTALVASIVPRNRSGYALGMMQSAVFVGGAVGPLVGGALTELMSYRAAFIAAGIAMATGGFLVHFVADESFPRERKQRRSERGTFGQVFRTPGFVALVTVWFTLRFANHIVYPVFPVLVKSLWGGTQGLRLATGAIYAVAGFAVVLAAGRLGRLSDRVGHKPMLAVFSAAAALAALLHVPAQDVVTLLVVRVFFAVAVAGMIAAGNALIHQRVHDQNIGKAYGVTSSMAALGWGLGPLVGGYLAVATNLRVPFIATAGAFALAALLVVSRVPAVASVPAEALQPEPEGK